MSRLSPADARAYWMSAAIPNDQFLVYCFADHGVSLSELADMLRRRATAIDDLTLRLLEIPGDLDLPRWVHSPIHPDQVMIHAPTAGWTDVLDRLGSLAADQLDPRRSAWRVHLFAPVDDTPLGRGMVVALQICHCLGDGRRTSAIARKLFSDQQHNPMSSVPSARMPLWVTVLGLTACGALAMPVRFGQMCLRGIQAFRAVREHPVPPAKNFPATRLNRPPGQRRYLRVVVGERGSLPRTVPVTVGALTAISYALQAYLDDPDIPIGAELTIGRTSTGPSANNFGNAGIDLHTEIDDVRDRAGAIAAEIADARLRDNDPTRLAERRATDATPAALMHWGIRRFDTSKEPESMTGVTVVSSVNRGAADLRLGGGPVMFTTGFPALSPAQGLTHGVHGIGDRVALSVTTSPEIMPDVDRYLAALSDGLERVRAVDPHTSGDSKWLGF